MSPDQERYVAQDSFWKHLSHVLEDVLFASADLIQKEIRLLRHELIDNLETRLRASLWMAAAVALGAVAGLLVVEGLIFAIASFGLALHWSCFLVALVIAVLAAGIYLVGKSALNERLVPRRSLNQINQDIKIAKEQLT